MRTMDSTGIPMLWANGLRMAVLTALCATVAACGGGDTAAAGKTPKVDAVDQDSDTTITGSDTEADTPDSPDVASDTGLGTDDADVSSDASGTDDADTSDSIDAVDAGGCNGAKGAGCPCASVDDCNSGFCIDTPKGQQCAQLCNEGPCADNFKCQSTSGAGGDVVNICVPKYGKVCNPCSANAECQGPGSGDARCVDLGNNGAFCGVACKVSDECPAGYECSDVKDVTGAPSKQCQVKGGAACSCTEEAINLELSTKCFVANGDAKCEGKRTCLAKGKPNAPENGGLSGCYAPEPTPETCDGKDNDCNGKTDESTCDDKNPCTDDLCQGGGGCQNPSKTGPCDADGSVCTKDDKCVNGKCQAGEQLLCDDKNPCTLDACDVAKGCTATNNDGLGCDADNNECTQNDACQGGKCNPGTAKACDSGDQCVEGKCNIITGACKYTPKNGDPCNDGSSCTSADKCTKIDDANAKCGGDAVVCDDKNPCTADSCDPAKGCQHNNLDGSACNDNDACTEQDVCGGGKCAGAAIDAAKKCDDKNPCTLDVCKSDLGCVNKVTGTDGTVCDDGNPCTKSDTCLNGACAPGKNECTCLTDSDCTKLEDGNACNGTLYCDKSTPGAFKCSVDAKSIVVCDTSVNGPCQTVDCDTTKGTCVLTKKQNNLPCDADGSVCTKNDTCQDGKCAAGLVQNCDDQNPCTDDSCDPKSGCVNKANTSPCDADGNACTQGDVCASGTCVPGKTKACDDLEPCTKDTCDTTTAECKYAPLTQSCTDGNACTTGDACGNDANAKYTCIPGKAVSCDDGNSCTADSCDAVKGCAHVVDATIKAACYTGDPKTKGKGQCKDGTQQCKSDGSLGVCTGDVLPGPKELCDGVDNTCDGVTDEGCKPTGFTAHYTAAVVAGQSTKYGTRSTAGGSSVVGVETGTGKYTARLGFYVWLKSFLGL
jgi:hypothetical protein